MSGNNIIGEAAIRSGCRFYAGYPITPQNELTEYMAEHMRNAEGGVFIQSESEIADIHMITGASAAGARVMTSSSSPGISLNQEGISSMAACELPGIIVNIMRGGPGLGLAISKAIVEGMDGVIGFDSVAGQGATFYFDLPLAQPS
jgi:2-oxoglutarate ferredoxin oxidoreductase subunit alpha